MFFISTVGDFPTSSSATDVQFYFSLVREDTGYDFNLFKLVKTCFIP